MVSLFIDDTTAQFTSIHPFYSSKTYQQKKPSNSKPNQNNNNIPWPRYLWFRNTSTAVQLSNSKPQHDHQNMKHGKTLCTNSRKQRRKGVN
ncbi:hypothetical protein GmHk_19G056369 [Glycine max]|nr:hypothetical protein GmHk_19G056369 [Glycine max]